MKRRKVLQVDEDVFDKYEGHFMREIARTLRSDLKNLGVPDNKLCDAALSVAFSIASTLDNCAGMMQPDGTPLIPVLAFAKDADYANLVVRRGGTYMHEYIGDVVKEICREKSR